MSRQPGHNGQVVAERESREDVAFGLKRARQDLELVKLRVNQAMRRGAPRDLLQPADELLSETIELISRLSGA